MTTRVKPRYLENNQTSIKKAFIDSLGCSKNLVNSEKIASFLQNHGICVISNWEDVSESDLMIINTCGFIQSARNESDAVINKYNSLVSKNSKILVVGCYASRFARTLRTKFPKCQIIDNQDPLEGIRDYLNLAMVPGTQRTLSTPHYAYLEIATGCNKACSYCLIPSIKGKFVSKPEASLIQEVISLVEKYPLKELILIAQDTSAYGSDLKDGSSLFSLLGSLSKIKEIQWIRILYLYPTLSMDQLKSILALDKVIPYLDMPLQHFSPQVLKAMKRPANIRKYLDPLFTYKAKNPSLTLRSTFMVGFPGETPEDFNLLLEGLAAYPFDRAGFFSYSREEYTESAQYTNQVHPSTKKARLKKAYAFQEKISERENSKYKGQVMPVLLDTYDNQRKVVLGRTYREAPEIDPEVIITGNPFQLKRKLGTFQNLKITETSAYEIRGTLVSP